MADWIEIDLSTLTDGQQRAYTAYKDAQREAARLRAAFEGTLPQPGPGKRLVCGYRFGRLSVAVVEDDRKPSKPKAAPRSLVDYLRDQD